MAHQIVEKLRGGDYDVARHRLGAVRREVPSFRKIVLAGHSAGGLIAELAAISFDDIAGLVVIAYSDVGASPLTMQTSQEAAAVCAAGGEPSDAPDGPPGYAYFGQAPDAFASAVFANAAPRIVAATVARRTRNPCGDLGSFMSGSQTNLANLGSIDVPVLLIVGAQDKLFPPPGVESQVPLFTGSDDVEFTTVPAAGHAISLERTAPIFRRKDAALARAVLCQKPKLGGAGCSND